MYCAGIHILHSIIILLTLLTSPTLTLAKATSEVFIATTTTSSSTTTTKPWQKRHQLSRINVVNTASDAATAINSERFMNLLADVKGGVNTSTEQVSEQKQNAVKCISQQQQHNSIIYNQSKEDSSWVLTRWLFGGGGEGQDTTDSPSAITTQDANCLPIDQGSKIPSSSHETITEYTGRLWFLSNKKGGIRFRETIRVISISSDGQRSTVECISQYYNGNKWIDCSKVVCNFIVTNNNNNGHRQRIKDKVKMMLEGEVLVPLPLPKVASKAVGKKIITVFEQAALAYFQDLSTT